MGTIGSSVSLFSKHDDPMDTQHIPLHSLYEPYTPRRLAWLMFRVASLSRLIEMQKGLLYMNSLAYFSSIEEASSTALRKDPLEKVWLRARAGPVGKYTAKIMLEIGEEDEKRVIDAGPEAVMTMDVPNPERTMVFCMAALADDENGIIPNERSGKIYFDERFLEFGSHALLITNVSEFAERLNKEIAASPYIHGGPQFRGGYGLVQYLDLGNASGHIGIFRKDQKYSWQQEYRICFGVKPDALNTNGAFEFRIGNISDISQILPMKSLVDTPVSIRRWTGQLVNGEFVPSDNLAGENE